MITVQSNTEVYKYDTVKQCLVPHMEKVFECNTDKEKAELNNSATCKAKYGEINNFDMLVMATSSGLVSYVWVDSAWIGV